MHKSVSGFCTSLDTLGEINFQSKLRLKTSNIFVWKLFRQKKKVKGHVETFRKFLVVELWGAETLSDQSKTQATCNMVVIDTNQWVSMEKGCYCTFVPPLFWLMILVQTFMLINNHIETWVWKSTEIKSYSSLKFFKVLINHHKKTRAEHTTMLNISHMSITFLRSIYMMHTWFPYVKRQKT